MKNTKQKNKQQGKTGKSSKPASGKDNNSDNAQEFPGYPPYPPEEDIMNRSNKVVRIEGDLENTNSVGRGLNTSHEQIEGIRKVGS